MRLKAIKKNKVNSTIKYVELDRVVELHNCSLQQQI